MVKTNEQKTIEKQMRADKKRAKDEIKQQRAISIVEGAPILAGKRFMDVETEALLGFILEQYDGNSNNNVNFNEKVLPYHISQFSSVLYETLQMYGMVSYIRPFHNGAKVILTETGKNYFYDKEAALEKERGYTVNQTGRKNIFISHRSIDKEIADMLLDFFVETGIPNNFVFCSSLPGNDISECISKEVKKAIQNSIVNIAILSKDYFESSYCLNEAGILWYLDEEAAVIVIGLPEIRSDKMIGFLNSEYKLRRLDNADDISAIYDIIVDKTGVERSTLAVCNRAIGKLARKYEEYILQRVDEASEEVNSEEVAFTTDDEKIVVTYIVEKQVCNLEESEVLKWVRDEEIEGVNIQNAFTLLAANGNGEYNDHTLKLDILFFRKMLSNKESFMPDCYVVVNRHKRLSVDMFKSIWSSLPDYCKLFVLYIRDKKVKSFGTRWMAKGQIEHIQQWEKAISISKKLSNNYENAIQQFIDNDLVYESSWTSYDNPKEYTLRKSIMNYLFTDKFEFEEELEIIKNQAMTEAFLNFD